MYLTAYLLLSDRWHYAVLTQLISDINWQYLPIFVGPLMTKNLVLSRKLGRVENFFRCRTEVDFYRNFFVVGAYSRDLMADWTVFYRALRKTLLDYHILICNVFKESDHTVFRPIERATLGDLVEFDSSLFSSIGKPVSEQFMKEYLRKLLFHLYQQKPLIKLVVVGTHDLAAVFEHTISDGIVAPYFHEVFLKNLAYCDDPENDAAYVKLYGSAPSTIDMSTPVFTYAEDKKYIKHSLPPPMEMCMQDPNIDYSDNDPQHYSKVVPPDYPEKWPGRFPAMKDATVAYKLFNISPEQLKVILRRCKENKVTLTAYITYIQAMAFQPVYGDKHHFRTIMAVTLRRFLSPQKVESSYLDIFEEQDYKIMGNFAHMGLAEHFAPAKEFSWDNVKSISEHLSQTVVNDKLLSLVKPLFDIDDELNNNAEMFTSGLGKDKVDGAKLSSLGFFDFPIYKVKDREWTINDLTFAQDLAPGASEFVVNVISTLRGGLNIVFSFFDHCYDDVDSEIFGGLAALFRKLLLDNAGVTS